MAISDNVTVYGKKTDNIPRNIIKLKLEKEIGFKYPLEANPKRGYFSKITALELYRANLKQLIRTNKGERFMLPDYGCSLNEYLMEPLDSLTFEEIKTDIYNSISKYLDKISISKLQITENKQSGLNVKLFCTLRDEAMTKLEVEIEV